MREPRSPCPKCREARLRWKRPIKPAKPRCRACKTPEVTEADAKVGFCLKCYPGHDTSACRVAWPGHKALGEGVRFGGCGEVGV